MSAHLIDGEFQSDKYPACPAGKVPLSTKDPTAQDLLWEYAQRRRAIDDEFADDLEAALRTKGFDPARCMADGLNAPRPDQLLAETVNAALLAIRSGLLMRDAAFDRVCRDLENVRDELRKCTPRTKGTRDEYVQASTALDLIRQLRDMPASMSALDAAVDFKHNWGFTDEEVSGKDPLDWSTRSDFKEQKP